MCVCVCVCVRAGSLCIQGVRGPSLAFWSHLCPRAHVCVCARVCVCVRMFLGCASRTVSTTGCVREGQ